MILFGEIRGHLQSAEKYFSFGDLYSSLAIFEKLERLYKQPTAAVYDTEDYGLFFAEESFIKGLYFFSEKRFFLSFREMRLAAKYAELLPEDQLLFLFLESSKELAEFLNLVTLHKNDASYHYNSLPFPALEKSKILALESEKQKENLVSLLNERDIANLSGNQNKVFNLDRVIWDLYHLDPNPRFEPFFT